MVMVLEEDELRRLAGVDFEAFEIIENSFAWLAQGKVAMPPIMHISIPEHNGDIDIKSAYVRGLDTLAVKLGSGFFGNQAKGLPSSSSIMAIMSTETGICQAILLENGYLTNLRTGMAGAVAAKWLAPEDVETVGIIGAGAQGRFQLECLRLVRNFTKVKIFSQFQDEAEIYATEMSEKLGVEVSVSSSAEDVTRSSQILVTTTPSREPIVQSEWLHPGLHITAMGADVGGKQELAANCTKLATLLVCDNLEQSRLMGEFQHSMSAEATDKDLDVVELGSIVAGHHEFKREPSDITICDLTGMGVQDTAIASLAMERHRSRR